MSILSWFKRASRKPNQFGCTHRSERRKFSIDVRGTTCSFNGADACIPCFERYLNQHCTICAHCSEPIFPGDVVASAWIGASHPYTHCTFKCGEGIFWSGTWGEGRLVPIEETHDRVDSGNVIQIRPKKRA